MKGTFDKSGYEIDHIEEYVVSQDNNIDNLQALCSNCHSLKTIKFMNEHNKNDIKIIINCNKYDKPFKCDACKYTTNIKCRLDIHNNSTKHKIISSQQDNAINKLSKCKFCERFFSKGNKSKHQKKCKKREGMIYPNNNFHSTKCSNEQNNERNNEEKYNDLLIQYEQQLSDANEKIKNQNISIAAYEQQLSDANEKIRDQNILIASYEQQINNKDMEVRSANVRIKLLDDIVNRYISKSDTVISNNYNQTNNKITNSKVIVK